ncbi:MAG: hydroxymethylbilane synthase [bacterium]
MARRRLVVGTRGSNLALVQTNQVIQELGRTHPDVEFQTHIIKSEGDRDRQTALTTIGGTGVFTRKLEQALLEKQVDLVVHSAKDLPSQMTQGLTIAAVPARGPVQDVLIAAENLSRDNLPKGSRVGTGSPRRQAQLRYIRPDLVILPIRGNVETRLAKLDSAEYDAIVLAAAGLERLGLKRDCFVLAPQVFLPAPGQGALLVQARGDDSKCLKIAATIDDPETRACLLAERQLLHRLQVGCTAAVGGWARIDDGVLRLNAAVLDKDGTIRLLAEKRGRSFQAEAIATGVADDLLNQGADRLLKD